MLQPLLTSDLRGSTDVLDSTRVPGTTRASRDVVPWSHPSSNRCILSSCTECSFPFSGRFLSLVQEKEDSRPSHCWSYTNHPTPILIPPLPEGTKILGRNDSDYIYSSVFRVIPNSSFIPGPIVVSCATEVLFRSIRSRVRLKPFGRWFLRDSDTS